MTQAPAWFALIALLATTAPALGQVDGHVSAMFDVLPDVDPAAGAQHVSELRTRLFGQWKQEVGEHFRLTLGGYVDALGANRFPSGGEADAIVRPADVHADLVFERVDVRVGFSRVVWGRLDEIQPTDVVNPLDLTRFLLEGRAEARLPVGLVRTRLFFPRSTALEAIVVPVFRAGAFDQLDEPTSPFNLLRSSFPTLRFEPDAAWQNVQGGARLTSTVGRVDWGVSAYRGFRAFPVVVGVPPDPGPGPDGGETGPRPGLDEVPVVLHQTFPRFTMVGGDFETVRGTWGLRGEVAAFTDADSVEGGVGVDRRAGDYRFAANILYSWRPDTDPLGDSLTVVGAADRTFARETRTLRVFAAWNPDERTLFGRVIAAVSLRDNLWLEGSAGVFAGSSLETIGLLTNRDFLYARFKAFF
jgi:hypothetical protein